MSNRIDADKRTSGPVSDAAVPIGDRGGQDHETDGPESDATAAHSSRGFKRALLKSGTTQELLPDRVKKSMPTHTRQGFAQGGGRHGLHIGNAGQIDHGKAKFFGKKGGKKS